MCQEVVKVPSIKFCQRGLFSCPADFYMETMFEGCKVVLRGKRSERGWFFTDKSHFEFQMRVSSDPMKMNFDYSKRANEKVSHLHLHSTFLPAGWPGGANKGNRISFQRRRRVTGFKAICVWVFTYNNAIMKESSSLSVEVQTSATVS